MRIRASWVASGVVIAVGCVMAITSGCGDDDPEQAAPAKLARKGEACQTTNDCSPGLACLPQSSAGGGGVCVVGVFNVARTAKECAIVDCEVQTDCCDDLPSNCASLKASCEFQRDAGNPTPSTCTDYELNCLCDPSRVTCEANKCVAKCQTDTDCIGKRQGPKCLGGTCAACASDGDCRALGPDRTCVSGKCQAPCKGDGDCPGFDRCLAGKCTAGGCVTTRECIAATRNVEATCGTDGKCIVPCQTDLECGNPKAYSFFSCVNNQCLYMGCETEKDCRLYVSGFSSSSSSSGSISTTERVVCRDPLTPNGITAPQR
jgi:hypothetical protein